jgi:DnaK suppressor protein
MSKTTGAKAAKTAAKKPVPKALAVAKGSKVLAGGKPVSNAKPKAGKAAPKTGSAKTTAAKIKTTAGAGKAKPAKPATPNAPARTMASAKLAVSKKSEGTKKKMASRVKIAEIVLPAGYKPSEDEPFMSDMHKAYFRKRLLEWKDEILRQTRETLAILHEDSTQHADLADRATSETDRATELRTRDRQRKLIAKIDAALGRIEDGSYGYCEDTGEPIGLKRLDARPIATLSVEAQERHERRERVYREE